VQWEWEWEPVAALTSVPAVAQIPEPGKEISAQFAVLLSTLMTPL
jgi:hypothetical protein